MVHTQLTQEQILAEIKSKVELKLENDNFENGRFSDALVSILNEDEETVKFYRVDYTKQSTREEATYFNDSEEHIEVEVSNIYEDAEVAQEMYFDAEIIID